MDIKTLANRINEYSNQLSGGTLSDIERDILLSDLRQLYILAKAEKPIIEGSEEGTHAADPVSENTIIAPQKGEELPAIPVRPAIEFLTEAPAIQRMQDASKAEETSIAEADQNTLKEPATSDDEPIQLETRRIHYHEGSPVRGPKPSSLNEVYTGEDRTLNAMAGGEKKRALNDRVAGTDLNNLLDLNRKHVLTNELFGGDSQAFQAAIRRINESPTIEAAFEYIKTELLPKYQWKGDMQSAKLFDKLVRQKFGV